MDQNGQMTDFGIKHRPTLVQIICGTKCDKNKRIFFQEEKVNKIELGIDNGPNRIGKCQ